MKLPLEIKNNQILTKVNIPDGVYDCEIKIKEQSHTLQQLRLLWKTIDEISKAQYGNTSESQNIYFQILAMSGVSTQKLAIKEECLNDFIKKVRTLVVIGNEIINHEPYVIVNACFKGVSEMNRKELSQVIENTIMFANENGIQTELERW